MKYTLPELPYAYNALEPYIDEATMKIHHTKHHNSYVEKLNKALENFPQYQKPVEELLVSLETLPKEIVKAVRNNGGGHANHTLFWTLLISKGPKPSEALKTVLGNQFGTFENFKKEFTKTSVEHFASGWSWLCATSSGELKVFSTKDHDSPLTQNMVPLLVLDLWEHAYYLKYQNKRPEFVDAFWEIVNWKEVEARWNEFTQKGFTFREWKIAG